MLAYLFPTRADFARAVGKEAGDSRIWAGIHYPMDNVAGVALGKSVAGVFIAWAEKDGSQLVPIGTESVALTGSIDAPADGAVVTGNLTVSGWARVPGSDLGVTVLIDGVPRFAIDQARVARPDVQAAVPALGDCSTAGYQQHLPLLSGRPGNARADGRLRGRGRPRAPLPDADVHLEGEVGPGFRGNGGRAHERAAAERLAVGFHGCRISRQLKFTAIANEFVLQRCAEARGCHGFVADCLLCAKIWRSAPSGPPISPSDTVAGTRFHSC